MYNRYLNAVRTVLPGILFVSTCSILIGCFGGGPRTLYPQIEGKGTVAVVSFSLDNSVVEKGAEKDTGPGLLQKKERYYEHHKEAAELMWTQFKENIVPAFDNAPFMGFDEVSSNAKYTELTTYPSKKVLGMEMKTDANEITPEGMGYVSGYDNERLEQIAVALGVDILLLVDFDAALEKSGTALSINNVDVIHKGKISLTSNLMLYQKGVGEIWHDSYTAISDSEGVLISHQIKDKDLPKLIPEAQAKLYTLINASVKKGKEVPVSE